MSQLQEHRNVSHTLWASDLLTVSFKYKQFCHSCAVVRSKYGHCDANQAYRHLLHSKLNKSPALALLFLLLMLMQSTGQTRLQGISICM